MSHDTKSKLVYMANQIATFFKSQPASEAVEGVANHINKFWEPRMRRQLFEILETEENGLDALVLQAAPMIRKPAAEANQVR
ncbi:formate dehydrogenase subunit delta [Rhizobium leguminosarum bv. trifolii CB782]|uniref:Formate dehydrogenase n=1 Tax=Rhizobium hidalgonense TaxID=1538159 RepID=A0A2A6KHR7_9HYPH|nr:MULTISPECIES: formate dehydrogenase subunit delta [Rhizobium]AHG47156.1 formate dehydrogenase subunit delta [Rhizobium leguminosarum bv. trifolii CB782]EJC76055.1 NADH-dependent formate dehydrogenase delta subunit FdsD [Rhizobium leguminosarum bv. trifolii WSM2012]ARM90284.1 FdsD family formate dehydrogenase delta subunit protein [Rhizobium sp. CIAT894]MDR9773945.1 formate dehydrogenase subunit delta [Rhizobium hidalgonense]MDR9806523.1 formate dehydrogenase subunit delta [Rhizobium hidalgo